MNTPLEIYVIIKKYQGHATIYGGYFYLNMTEARDQIDQLFEFQKQKNPEWIEKIDSRIGYGFQLVSKCKEWGEYRIERVDRHDCITHYIAQEAEDTRQAKREILGL